MGMTTAEPVLKIPNLSAHGSGGRKPASAGEPPALLCSGGRKPAVRSRHVPLVILLVALLIPATAYGADLSKATQLFNAKSYTAAVTELNNLLKNGKPSAAESARIYYLLGCCYYSSNRLDDAQKLFAAVVQSHPTREEAKLSAQMLQRMGSPL